MHGYFCFLFIPKNFFSISERKLFGFITTIFTQITSEFQFATVYDERIKKVKKRGLFHNKAVKQPR